MPQSSVRRSSSTCLSSTQLHLSPRTVPCRPDSRLPAEMCGRTTTVLVLIASGGPSRGERLLHAMAPCTSPSALCLARGRLLHRTQSPCCTCRSPLLVRCCRASVLGLKSFEYRRVDIGISMDDPGITGNFCSLRDMFSVKLDTTLAHQSGEDVWCRRIETHSLLHTSNVVRTVFDHFLVLWHFGEIVLPSVVSSISASSFL